MIGSIKFDLIKKYIGETNRQAEVTWTTLYNRMSNQGVFKQYKTQR